MLTCSVSLSFERGMFLDLVAMHLDDVEVTCLNVMFAKHFEFLLASDW